MNREPTTPVRGRFVDPSGVPARESLKTSAGSELPGCPLGPILVVEDEVSLRAAVSSMLRKRGFSVLQAATGEFALELIRTEKTIPIVLLDLTLPGKSGREVLEELRKIHPGTRVILTSAHELESLPASLKRLRHEGFIRKPYRFTELENLLLTS